MEKIIYFDVAALILAVIMLIAFSANKLNADKSNRYFLILFVTSTLSGLFDLLCLIFDNSHACSRAVLYLSHWFYLTTHFLTAFFYCIYLAQYTHFLNKLRQKSLLFTLFMIPLLVLILNMIITIFTSTTFYINDQLEYVRASGMLVNYVGSIVYMVIGLVFVLLKLKSYSFSYLLGLISVFPLTIAAMVFQFFKPTFAVEIYFNMMGLLLIYCTVQRPTEIINPISDTYNDLAFSREIRNLTEVNKPVRLLYINISNFQYIRNAMGSKYNSMILKRLSTTIKQIMKTHRARGIVYYMQNGVFNIVMENADSFPLAEIIGRDIVDTMERGFVLKNAHLIFHAKVCLTSFPEDISTYNDFFSFQDVLSEQLPSSSFVKASDLLSSRDFKIRLKIDQIVNNALISSNFSVYYQPIWSSSDKRLSSAEALLRLKTEEFGFIDPELIIRSAEQSGAIHEIGAYVLGEVCRFLASPAGKSLNLKVVNVNLSVVQCMSDNLAEQLISIVDSYQVPHSLISFEITETVMDSSFETLHNTLLTLVDAGFTIAIDDFGTGYSSFSRLMKLPVKVIKIDRSLIYDINEGSLIHSKCLEHIVRLIHSLDYEVVVEGVENEEELKFCDRLGCDYMQGYYFSKPLQQNDFVSLIRCISNSVL